MSDVTVIGLGAMGSALARTLLNADYTVTVWNRSPEKIEPLVVAGAKGAASVFDAINASMVAIICVNDYDTSKALLDHSDITPLLEGRTVIQLTTGTPKEAGDSGLWVNTQGGRYLDGAIMVYPGQVGTAEAQILMTGPEETFENCRALLGCLGGDLRYLGTNIRAAAALDLALIYRLLGRSLGTTYGALVCEAEGASVAQYASLLPQGERSRTIAELIHADDFSIGENSASGNVVRGLAARLQSQARDARIDSALADLALSLQRQSNEAGYGHLDAAVVIKILRDRGNTEQN
ncbi:MAG: NAD(P)-binding domain-containing protein [Alphaproteobacteria bacterium]|nr:NAD(P)-binding domain-containing protein [Alphaproteobacteria bacterium]